MKKQFFLLLILIFSLSFTISCKNKSDKKVIDDKKISKNLAKELDFSYFPAEATVIAVIDFQSIYNVKAFGNMLKEIFDEIKKENGIDVSKIKSLSAFLSIKDFKTNPFSNAAIILDGINISKVKNFPEAIKTEKFEGLNISIFDDKTGFVFVDKKTIGGTLVSVKNAISLSKGKAKNLASTPRNNDFKNIISKLNGSQISVSFVSNKETDIEIKKLASNPKFSLISNFLNNLKSAAFGLKIDDKNISFIIVTKSSREGVEALAALANLQIQQYSSSMLEAKLKMFEPVITTEGVNIVKNMLSTLRVKGNGEYLTASIHLTVKDAMKLPEIFMKLGLTPISKKR